MRHERSSVCLPVNTVANYVHFSFHLLPPPPTPSYTFLATTSTSNTAAWSTKTKVIERNWLIVLMFSFLSFLPRAGSFIPFLSLSPALRYAFFFVGFTFLRFTGLFSGVLDTVEDLELSRGFALRVRLFGESGGVRERAILLIPVLFHSSTALRHRPQRRQSAGRYIRWR